MARKKSNYSQSEKIAYYSGMGYRVSHEGKRIVFKKPGLRENFKQGYMKAGSMMLRNPGRYPKKK